MNLKNLQKSLLILIAFVWFANGLFCKVLNVVPRHQEIVSKILGSEYAQVFTVLIGFSEIIMAIWILSKFKTVYNTITQVVIVAAMNTLEFILVPDLLLWGKLNSFFAFLFIVIVLFNEFYINKKLNQQT